MNCTYVHLDKTNGRKSPCQRPTWRGKAVCVFHSPDVVGKSTEFRDGLLGMLAASAASDRAEPLDFKGFIFPKLDIQGQTFNGDADFRGAVFTDSVDFRKSEFHGDADFHTTEFLHNVNLCWCFFGKDVRFLGTKFHGRAIFSACNFRGTTAWHGCKFEDFAAWQASKFNTRVVFQSNVLGRDGDFRHAVFYRGVDFGETLFQGRTDFQGCRFHDEVVFSKAHIKFLKKLRCHHARMDGAVLHTAQIWENDTLSHYSFRSAFLLSVNLSGKFLHDCDFTGAVFKAVLTAGWKPDYHTLLNTKYIYTDYVTHETRGSDGVKRRTYAPVPESRVPADGNFGEGEHSRFTLADYLRIPARWNVALNVPPVLRTAVTNYLQLFTDFLEVTRGIPVELRTRLEGSKLRVEFLAHTEEDLAVVQQSFAEYQRNTGRDFEELKLNIAFGKHTTPLDRDLFLMKLETQVNNLKTELTYTKALLTKTEENKDLLAQLVAASRAPRSLLQPLALPPATQPRVPRTGSSGLQIVFSYAHTDEALRNELETHLGLLKRKHLATTWHDRCISPGTRWEGEIDDHFRTADIVLLLISADFTNSAYCFETEMKIALDRERSGDARVIPVILRHCDWQTAPFGKLHGLPRDMRPIVTWEHRDEAWLDVVGGIRKAIDDILEDRRNTPSNGSETQDDQRTTH